MEAVLRSSVRGRLVLTSGFVGEELGVHFCQHGRSLQRINSAHLAVASVFGSLGSRSKGESKRNESDWLSQGGLRSPLTVKQAPLVAQKSAYVKPSTAQLAVAEGRAAPSSLESADATINRGIAHKSDDYFTTDDRPVILFDGVCNLCNAGVNFVLDNDPVGKLRFAALQSPAGRALLERSGRSPDDISSIVLVEKNRSFTRSDAVMRIGQRLRLPYPALAATGLLTPSFVRDLLYEWVAEHRYVLLGERNSCRFSDDGFHDRFVQ